MEKAKDKISRKQRKLEKQQAKDLARYGLKPEDIKDRRAKSKSEAKKGYPLFGLDVNFYDNFVFSF